MNAVLLSGGVIASVSPAQLETVKDEVAILQKIFDDAKAVSRGADLQLEPMKDDMLAPRNPGWIKLTV